MATIATRVLPVVAAALLLVGCFDGRDAPAQSPSTASAPTATVSKAPNVQTFIGQVDAGVEAGCLVLRAQEPAATYVLTGETADLAPGQQVQLSGVVDADAVSTCQQGPVLRVTAVQSAD